MAIFREEIFQLPEQPEIIFEDYYLAVLFKPYGYSVERHPHYKSLEDFYANHLRKNHPERKEHFIGIVHRLDVLTGGIVIIAKTPMALKNMNEQFAKHSVEKKYLALVEGVIDKNSGRLEGFIEELKSDKKAIYHAEEKTGSKKSALSFEKLDGDTRHSLLKINLETGRFHQIRATFFSIGNPVVNDEKYGAIKVSDEKKIFLVAHEIKIAHPKTNERLNYKIKISL